MITSYILDLDSLQTDFDLNSLRNIFKHLDTEQKQKTAALKQQQANLRHLSHWVRGLKANGVLFIQPGWIGAIDKALGNVPEDRHSDIADFIKMLQEGTVTLEATADQMSADCLIGTKVPVMAKASISVPLVQYFASETERQREDDLRMHSFSRENQRKPNTTDNIYPLIPYYYDECIRRFTRYSNEIHLIDRIWGNKIDNLDTTLRFAHSIAKLLELVLLYKKIDETLDVKIYTEPWNWKPTKADANKSVHIQYKRAVEMLQKKSDDVDCTLNKHFYENLRALANTVSPEHKGILNFDVPTRVSAEAALREAMSIVSVNPERIKWSISVRQLGHDRYLATRHHVMSFGSGFDIYRQGSDSIREFNIYYAGNRRSVSQHVSLLAPKSLADRVKDIAYGE